MEIHSTNMIVNHINTLTRNNHSFNKDRIRILSIITSEKLHRIWLQIRRGAATNEDILPLPTAAITTTTVTPTTTTNNHKVVAVERERTK
jgi:hypothetical protein